MQFFKHPNINYFITYTCSYIALGAAITALGPLVPFLASQANRPETDYSLLFFFRSFGMIAGAIVLKFIEHRVNYHQLQAICSGVSCLFLGFFSIAPDGLIQYVTLFIASMFCLLIDVAVNVNMISLYRAEEIDFWMLSIHGTFGIGGLIGPLIVWMFETNSYIVIGLLMATMIPSYLYLQSPEIIKRRAEEHHKIALIKAGQGNEIKHSQSGHPNPFQLSTFQHLRNSHISNNSSPLEPFHAKIEKTVPNLISNFLAFMMFLYIGLQCAFGNWISSYAVLSNVQTKEEATSLGTLFWIAITLFRFVFAWVSAPCSKKMIWLINGSLVCSVLAVIIINADLRYFACIFGSITYGICFSSIFGLVLSLPNQFGFCLSPKQTSAIFLVGALAQGVLAMLVGILMQYSPDMFFYSIMVIEVAYWYTGKKVLSSLEAQIHKQMLLPQHKEGYTAHPTQSLAKQAK